MRSLVDALAARHPSKAVTMFVLVRAVTEEKYEWSEWDERHRRQSCEGSSERVWVTSEFQLRSKKDER
jgi:hypothetical protein